MGTVEKPESNLHLGQVGTGPYTLVPAQVNTVLKLDVLHPSSARFLQKYGDVALSGAQKPLD